MTLHEHVAHAARRLERAGLSAGSAAVDAGVLARAALGCDRATYLTRLHQPPGDGFVEPFEQLVARRARREPVAQILGVREFWGRDFVVSPAVLIPRPETELIVEEALARFARCPPRRALDVGTGSGCLAVTLALEFPESLVVATEISSAALDVARDNAERLGASAQVRFVQTNLLDGIAPDSSQLIVANPPYVPSGARPALSPEVRDYEPAVALFGGSDGLETIRRLLPAALTTLERDGWLVMEFGAGADDDVRAAIESRPGFLLDTIREDLQGIPRVAVARKVG
jgi:release factor glutamine methyltransferase